ncbi:MAG: UvrD-helicase domain-containing protein [archaeon]
MGTVGEDEIDPIEKSSLPVRLFRRYAPDPLVRLWLGDPDEQRREFEQAIATLEDELASLNEEETALLDDEHYLTTCGRREFSDSLQHAIDAYDDLRSTRWPFPYSSNDRERLHSIRSELQALTERLDGYNESFVERQLEQYENLFTDIDEAGHDLNRDQRKAVVRNDEYNQVIAGAGTGKTLVLTHRIAYLIERGVDPDRIAAVTLTRNAREEIQKRLEERFGITEVTVETIHSFANGIARQATDRHRSTIGDQDRRNFVEERIREKLDEGDATFTRHYRQFLTHYSTETSVPDDHESRAEFVRDRSERSYETLGGETVASQAEKAIADFLFTHGVEYQYEAIAEWAETGEDRDVYSPDFYLPEYDITIEHWGIDENGDVAPWFSWTSEEYREKLAWARQQFASSDHTLVETYDFEYWAGNLEQVLTHRLARRGVRLDPMSFDDLVDHALDDHEREQHLIGLFAKFIDNAGTFDTDPEEIRDDLSRHDPREYHFGVCGAILLEEYEDWKRRNGLVDFDDMIYDAVAAVREDPDRFQSQFEHVLVDEFQDVAISQIRLLDALTDGPDAPHLFCVGDDWQSIYAFRGAVVEYFVDFEEYFGPAAITELRETYRCPETVLDASTDLIANNPTQIGKNPAACSGRDTRPQLHVLDGYNEWQYAERVGEYAANIVEQYLNEGSDPDDVMILSRYDSGAPFVDQVKDALEARDIPYDGKADGDRYRPDNAPAGSDAGVSVFSAHQAKGREASHVILLNVAQGEDGFAPDVRNNDLLNPVRDVSANTEAEERRLFYVALTRSERTIDLLTKAGKESAFLDEIDAYLARSESVVDPGEVGDRVRITATVATLWDDTHESQAQAGLLEDESGRIKFVSWERTDPPVVAEGERYVFDEVEVSEYNGDREIHFTESTTIQERERGNR